MLSSTHVYMLVRRKLQAGETLSMYSTGRQTILLAVALM